MSSNLLSKGEYDAHMVVDSESETGGEGMTISFSISVTSSQMFSSYEVYYEGNETDGSYLGSNGLVNESAGSNFIVRNDEVVVIGIEPRDLDNLPILSADDNFEVKIVNGSSCQSISSWFNEYFQFFECSFSYSDVGLFYVDVMIEGVSIGSRVVNVKCKESMVESSGTCTCGLGEELVNEDCSLCDSSSFKTSIGDGPCDSCPIEQLPIKIE